MSVGDRHTLNGYYEYTETLHGPFGPDTCVDCGTATVSVVPTGRIGAGGRLEDTGAGIPSRCSACGRVHHGAPAGAVTAATVAGVPSPASLDARIVHDAVQAPAAPAVPAPEHISRQPIPQDIPRALGPRQVAQLAKRHGWMVESTYARGPWLNVRGVVAFTAHTLAVRGQFPSMARPRQFHALYVRPVGGDKWTCDHVLLLPVDPAGVFPHASVTDLKEWIEREGEVPLAWYDTIRWRLAAQKEAAQEKAKSRPRKIKEDHA